MTRGAISAVLVLAASVVAAAPPASRSPARALQPAAPLAAQRPRQTQEFHYRGLTSTTPANWSVRQADRMRFRSELVTVTGRPSGPRLTFSDTMQYAKLGEAAPMPRAGASVAERSRSGVPLERYEMPNAAWRGILYVFPGAGVSVSAQVRNEAEARAADAIVQSARRALLVPRPTRS
jgi:hypothetical protein